MKIHQYRRRLISEWEKVEIFGMHPKVKCSEFRDETYILLDGQHSSSVYIFRQVDWYNFPAAVKGLDWETFADTMRVPVWVAMMIYERGEEMEVAPTNSKEV